MAEKLHVFKGTDKDMRCNNYQFELGKTHTEKTAKLCSKGFHACENPLDVLKYYSPGEGSRYFEAELDATDEKHDEDTKRVGKSISLKTEIGIKGIINAGLKFTFKKVEEKTKEINWDNAEAANSGYQGTAANSGTRGTAANSGTRGTAANSGDYGTAANSGDYGTAANSGYQGTAANSGYRGTAANSGDYGTAANSGHQGTAANSGTRGTAANSGHQGTAANSGYQGTAANSGDYGTAANSGHQGTAANSGYQGTAANSGHQGTAANSGDYGTAANSGDYGTAETTVKDTVALASGYEGRARGVKGSVLFLIERNDDMEIIAHKSIMVDGKRYKENTSYILRDGKVVKADG